MKCVGTSEDSLSVSAKVRDVCCVFLVLHDLQRCVKIRIISCVWINLCCKCVNVNSIWLCVGLFIKVSVFSELVLFGKEVVKFCFMFF